MIINKEIDLLERNDYVIQLKNIIDLASFNKGNESILLYGGWGSGKSFLLNLLENELSKDNYLVIKYDAWDRDFYDEPLVGILYSFATQLNECLKLKHFVEGLTENIALGILHTFSLVIGAITNKAIGIDIPRELKKAYKYVVATRNKKEIKTTFNQNIGVEEARSRVRDELITLASNTKVVLLIDEIDRCLPDYAIKVLERLHHFVFNIPGLQAVTAVDKSQLANIINSYYGNKADVDRYLQKFFNLSILLNEGNFNKNFQKRYNDYVSLFSKRISFIKEESIDEFVKVLFNHKNARLIDRTVEKAYLVHNLLKPHDSALDKTSMCVELLLSFMSLIGNKNTIFEDCFSRERCNPQHIEDTVSAFKNAYLVELAYSIDSVRNRMHRSGVDVMIRVDGIWSLIWYVIILNSGRSSVTKYSFGCNENEENVHKKLNEIFKYSELFVNKAFIL